MREIVLDTETTGLDPAQGHKIVEIGCVELINHTPTGRTFQEYLNPERLVDEEVIAVHGITNEFVKDKPTFKEVADKFIEFIGDPTKYKIVDKVERYTYFQEGTMLLTVVIYLLIGKI